MGELILFTIVVVVFASLYIGFMMYRADLDFNYFKTKEGKKIRFGIVAALVGVPLIGFILLILPNNTNATQSDMFEGTWFNYAGVELGMEITKNKSPQCKSNGVDQRGTSNIGAFVNVWQNTGKTISVDWQLWRHHSCIIGPDEQNYDATGLNIRWTPWIRKQ